MTGRGVVGVAVALGVLALAETARATMYETLGIGARATAMGGAYTAVADTPAAKYYNPAGLTQLIGVGPEADQGIGFRTVWTNFEVSQNTRSPQAVPPGETPRPVKYNETFFQPDLSGGFEWGDDFYVSLLAITTAWAGWVQYSENVGDQRFSAYEAGQLFINYTPRLAWRVNEWLSIGGGPDVQAFHEVKRASRLGDGYLTSSVARALDIEPSQAEALFSLLGARNDGIDDGKIRLYTDEKLPTGLKPFNTIDVNFRDVGFTLGVHLRPTEWLRFGLTYRSEIYIDTEGTAEFNLREEDPIVQTLQRLADTPFGPALGLDGFRDQLVPQSLRWVLPNQVAFGVAAQLRQDWLVSADAVWTEWSSREQDVVKFGGDGLGPPSFDDDDDPSTPDTGVRENVATRGFEDVISLRVGTEIAPLEWMRVRLGYWYDPHPQKDNDWYSMDGGFNTRHNLSAGIGLVGLYDGFLDVSLTFQHILFEDRTVAIGESNNLGGTIRSVDPVADGLANNDTFDLTVGGDITSAALELMFHF